MLTTHDATAMMDARSAKLLRAYERGIITLEELNERMEEIESGRDDD
jgi:hypothetical protein